MPYLNDQNPEKLKAFFEKCYGYRKMRQIIIYPGEDGYWIAECPSLQPCISQGKTKAEAIANIKEAIQLYIELLEEEGRPIPEDRLETALVDV